MGFRFPRCEFFFLIQFIEKKTEIAIKIGWTPQQCVDALSPD